MSCPFLVFLIRLFIEHGHVSRDTRTVRCARLGRTTNTSTNHGHEHVFCRLPSVVSGLLIPPTNTSHGLSPLVSVFRVRARDTFLIPILYRFARIGRNTNTSTPHEHVLSVRGLRSTVGGLLIPALRARSSTNTSPAPETLLDKYRRPIYTYFKPHLKEYQNG
jgi:hypothetical protein